MRYMAQPDERETRGLYEGLLAASDKHVSENVGTSMYPFDYTPLPYVTYPDNRVALRVDTSREDVLKGEIESLRSELESTRRDIAEIKGMLLGLLTASGKKSE
jgi:hypothetical protein